MADARTMVVQNEPGESHENPSGGLLWVLLESVGTKPDDRYLLMFAADDPQTYLIASRTEDGAFLLQMQDGETGSEFVRHGELSFEEAHEVLVRYAFGRTPWRDLGDWADAPPAA